MRPQFIRTPLAPTAIGPYEQALRIGDFIFTSGQIPVDPATGKIDTTDIATQTDQVLHNLSEILRAAGSSLQNVIKTTVFLTDMSNFSTMNAVYSKWFKDHKPARSTVTVAALPLDSLIEIEAIACSE